MITGNIKEIPLTGLSSTPSDYDCKDGDMHVCHNMVAGKAVEKPVAVKYDETTTLPVIENGGELVFVHNTSFGKVYISIMKNDFDINTLHCWKEGYEGWVEIYDLRQDEFVPLKNSITHVGNILIVSINDGLNYLRFKGQSTDSPDGYTFLGTEFPDIDVLFGLDAINVPIGDTDKGEIFRHLENGMNVLAKEGIDCDYLEFIDPALSWNKNIFDDMIFGTYNFIQNECRKRNLYIKPFFVRYAYKLYDGSYVMQSSPVLMIPSCADSMDVMVLNGSNNTETVYVHARGNTGHGDIPLKKKKAYTLIPFIEAALQWKVKDASGLKKWEEVIQEVCVFVTQEISSYSSTGQISHGNIITSRQWTQDFEGKSVRITADSNSNVRIYRDETEGDSPAATVITLPKRDGSIKSWFEDAAQTFYLIKSYTLDEMLGKSPTVWERIERDGEYGLQNLTTFERLEDGYKVRTKHYPKFIHTYNNRLNIANVVDKERETFPQGFIGAYTEGNNSRNAEVYIEEEGIWNLTTCSYNNWADTTKMSGFFFYPNVNAKYIKLKDNFWVKLSPHPYLNGSYYLNDNLIGFESVTAPSAINVSTNGVQRYNYIYTSEVDNPFLFPALGVNQIGSGKIKTIKSATKALSEGTAFGAQPLYVFTEDGIYALSVNSTGLYDRAAPVSRETVTDASKVLSIDNSIIFLNERGLMELIGQHTRCLSMQLADKQCSVDIDSIDHWNIFTGAMISNDNYGEATYFSEYIKDAKLAFDYVNYRIYVYGSQESTYAYVYDVGTKLWSTVDSSIKSSVEGYPATLINVTDGSNTKICQFSDSGSVESLAGSGNVLFLTRPMKFQMPDVLKTIRRVIMRGKAASKNTIKLALWASTDMQHWQYVAGIKEGMQIPNISGSPYKYFVVGGCATLNNKGDVISRLTIEEKEKHVNRLR